MNYERKIEQSKRAHDEFENSIRVIRASNGFVVKRPNGQFVYSTVPEVLKAVQDFCEADKKS